MSTLFLAFYILSTFVITDVYSLMCYDCNSLYDYDCEHLRKDDKMSLHYKYCTAKNESFVQEYQKPLCKKIVQRSNKFKFGCIYDLFVIVKTRNNMRVVKRYCGYELHQNKEEDVCYEVRNEDHEEVVCQCLDDGCNSANVELSNIYLHSACYIFFMFWYCR